jgi:hypothetical protein
VTQHASLTPERWGRFNLDQQVLMIGNEMQRASAFMSAEGRSSRQLAYERALRLLDLTVAVHSKPTLRRELLRWRDLVAALYAAGEADPVAHQEAFRCLLRFTPEASRQIPYVLP